MKKKGFPLSKPRARRQIPIVLAPAVTALAGAAVLALLLTPSGCGKGADTVTGPASYSVSGAVGEGVEGDGIVASVSISNDAGVIATTTTDVSGRFEFTGLEAGDMTVTATRREYAPAKMGVRVPPSTDRVNLRLMRLP